MKKITNKGVRGVTAFRFSALSSLIGPGEDASGFIYIPAPVSTSDLLQIIKNEQVR